MESPRESLTLYRDGDVCRAGVALPQGQWVVNATVGPAGEALHWRAIVAVGPGGQAPR